MGVAAYLHPKGNVIKGAIAPAQNGDWLDVEDPATAEVFSKIPASQAADVASAVASARASFPRGEWSAADPSHRGRVLWELARRVRESSEQLSYLETLDCGKPIAGSRVDIAGTADILEYYGGMATKIYGQTPPLPARQLGMLLSEPAGVVGLMGSSRFPGLVLRKAMNCI
jgi:acyl-CoA reductase-like NAD-dependent aldehyde dehydrogenase